LIRFKTTAGWWNGLHSEFKIRRPLGQLKMARYIEELIVPADSDDFDAATTNLLTHFINIVQSKE
jgi:hypothetical protein